VACVSDQAKLVDFTLAPDAETAEKQVAEAHGSERTCAIGFVAIRED
jgi:hypothetical protein